MSKASAALFLKRIDEDEQARKSSSDAAVKVGKDLGYKFTSKELEKALIEKWGIPKNREESDHPYTCCFSESLL